MDGTRVIAECARGSRREEVRIFTSTNCLWASNMGRPVREDDPPAPAELYGESKLAAERLLRTFEKDLDVVILRCPTIIDSGRLGLLAILFEFIRENKTVWVVGSGANRYQFIYAGDLAQACVQSLAFAGSAPSTSAVTMCPASASVTRPSLPKPAAAPACARCRKRLRLRRRGWLTSSASRRSALTTTA